MIKNYTSKVPAVRSISHIEEKLVAHGAQSIVKQYKEGKVAAVSFFLDIDGRLIPFRLPVKTDAVLKILKEEIRHPKIEDQAERTAWKIISDWVDIQMALIDLKQAEMAEIFMPYMWSEKLGQSYYRIASERGFGLLEVPKHGH